jgi:glucokinase
MKDRKFLIGIDIGGTKCAIVLGDYSGNEISIINKISFPTEAEMGPGYTVEKIKKAIYDVLITHSLQKIDIDGIGISCGGPLNSKEGLILSPPNLTGWHKIAVVKIMEDEFNIKDLFTK